jgi:TetR/AcrR family transcriptional regulator, transcriptional repressor for nem operon
MARYKQGHQQQMRERLILEASKLLRLHGFEGVSVAEVMKAAGLTHGGFYAHFKDKNELLVEALREAMKESPINFKFLSEKVQQTGSINPFIMGYLSKKRVDNRAEGCPAAALSSELPRQSAEIKQVFNEGLFETVEALSSSLENTKSWATFSMLYGGLALMRIIEDDAISEEIKKEITHALQKMHGL